MLLARWESRGGAHYAELHKESSGYRYSGNDCGGWFVAAATGDPDVAAVRFMQAKVDSGYFLPDVAKTLMKRVR